MVRDALLGRRLPGASCRLLGLSSFDRSVLMPTTKKKFFLGRPFPSRSPRPLRELLGSCGLFRGYLVRLYILRSPLRICGLERISKIGVVLPVADRDSSRSFAKRRAARKTPRLIFRCSSATEAPGRFGPPGRGN